MSHRPLDRPSQTSIRTPLVTSCLHPIFKGGFDDEAGGYQCQLRLCVQSFTCLGLTFPVRHRRNRPLEGCGIIAVHWPGTWDLLALHACHACRSGTLPTINEPALTRHDHPKPRTYVRIHSAQNSFSQAKGSVLTAGEVMQPQGWGLGRRLLCPPTVGHAGCFCLQLSNHHWHVYRKSRRTWGGAPLA